MAEEKKNIIEELMELLLKMFGVKAGQGKGGGMPLDQAIKQPGAENYAVDMLDDKMTQWACKKALGFDTLSNVAKNYLDDNPQVKDFAQKVLDNPRLKEFKNDLQEKGLLDKIGLNANKENSLSKNKETNESSIEMSAPKSSAAAQESIQNMDNYPQAESSSNSEPDIAPREESSNQMRLGA